MNIRKKHRSEDEKIKVRQRQLEEAILLKLRPVYVFGLATVIFFLDQLTKFFVRKNMVVGQEIKITPFFYLTHLENSGTFFGLAKHSAAFLTFFSVLVIGIILWNYKKIPAQKFLYTMAGLVLGGAFGNLIDRLFFGTVTDFFDFRIWPVFNIADCAISVAVVCLFWYAFKKEEKGKK